MRSGSCKRPVILGAFAVALAASGAHAQLARRQSSERILILNPVWGATDSAFAVTFGEALRERMASKYRFRLGIIPTETICEVLEASGFNCKGPLSPDNAPALARTLQATGYMVSWLTTRADSVVIRIRMVETARSGLAGWERFAAPVGESAEDFARDVTDGLDGRVRAAELSRECSERRERNDLRGALDRAGKVFEMYPNHPAAASCLSLAHELARSPLDSVIAALRKAVNGDSLNTRGWQDLGRRLQEKGDTTGALDAFINQLRANPTDSDLRQAVVAGLITFKRYDEAVRLLDEGLELSPGEVRFLALKERACTEASKWPCLLDAIDGRYALDSTSVIDSLELQKAFAAAQAIPDTAAMLKWSERAVQHFPQSVDLWRARGVALRAIDDRARALDAYDHILALDSSQVASALAAAQYLLDSTLVVDSTVPLDTLRLVKGERLAKLYAGASPNDTTALLNVAAILYGPAARITLLASRMPPKAQEPYLPNLALAERLLGEALAFDLRGQLRAPIHFFLGIAYFIEIAPLDSRVRTTKSCELVEQELALTQRARDALTIGRQYLACAAGQYLAVIARYEAAQKTYKPVFKCP